MNHADDRAHPDSGESSTDRSGPSQSEQEDSSEGDGPWRGALRDIAPYLDLGWRIMGVAAFPPLIGAYIDWQFQITPWGLFVGASIGLVGAGLQLRRLQQEFHS